MLADFALDFLRRFRAKRCHISQGLDDPVEMEESLVANQTRTKQSVTVKDRRDSCYCSTRYYVKAERHCWQVNVLLLLTCLI
jgi:hypothetical protein